MIVKTILLKHLWIRMRGFKAIGVESFVLPIENFSRGHDEWKILPLKLWSFKRKVV